MKLPTKITIDFTNDVDDDWLFEEIADYVSEKISKETGFCHKGFNLSVSFTADNIDWDTDED